MANYSKRIEQKFPCGCEIHEMIDESYNIVYCSKHKAAPLMYEALKGTLHRIAHTQKCNVHSFAGMTNLAIKTMIDTGFNNHCDCGLMKFIEQRDKALAKAEGEK